MKTLVPYTALESATAAALPGARFVELVDDDHYRRLLREEWLAGEPFVLVEHDVVPRPEQLAAFESCPEPWCGYGYTPGDWTPVFGCIRFGASLIEALPDAFSDPSWLWNQLDARFAVRARAAGFRWHWHSPHVEHLREPHFDRGELHRARRGPEEMLTIAAAELASIRSGSYCWYAEVDTAELAGSGTIRLKGAS